MATNPRVESTVPVDCCTNDLPTTLVVSLTGYDDCSWMDEAEFPIDYDGAETWRGSYSSGGRTINVGLGCGEFPNWFSVEYDCGGGKLVDQVEGVCDPLFVEDLDTGDPGCCEPDNGGFTITITEVAG